MIDELDGVEPLEKLALEAEPQLRLDLDDADLGG